LNENFGLTDTALLFNFNMYEIAARSMGETRIRALLRPEFQ
jgi:hypothetical protein